MDISDDILYYIIDLLDVYSIANLSQSCKHINQICLENKLYCAIVHSYMIKPIQLVSLCAYAFQMSKHEVIIFNATKLNIWYVVEHLSNKIINRFRLELIVGELCKTCSVDQFKQFTKIFRFQLVEKRICYLYATSACLRTKPNNYFYIHDVARMHGNILLETYLHNVDFYDRFYYYGELKN